MTVTLSIISGTVGDGNTVRLQASGIVSRGGIPFFDIVFGDVVLSNYDAGTKQIDCLINSLSVTPRIRVSSCPWEKPVSGNFAAGDVYQGMTLQVNGRFKATNGTNQMDLFGAGRINNDGDFLQQRGKASQTGCGLNIYDNDDNMFLTNGDFTDDDSFRLYCYGGQAAQHFRTGPGWPFDNDNASVHDGNPVSVTGGRPYRAQMLDTTPNRAVDFDFDRIEYGSGGWGVFSSPVYGITGYEEGFLDLEVEAAVWHKVKVGSGSVADWEDEHDVTGGSSASLGSITSNDTTGFFPDGVFATGRKRSGDISFTGIPTGSPNAWVHIKMGLMTNTGNPGLTCLAYAGSKQVFDANFAYITGVVKVVDFYVQRDGSGVCPVPKTTGTDAVLSAIAYKDEDPPDHSALDAEVFVIVDSIHKIWQGSTDDAQPHPGMAERIATAIGGNYFNYRSCADFNAAKNINVYNIGHEGFTLQNMDTEIAAHLGDLYKSDKLQIVVLTGGANNHTESDATIYGRMQTNKSSVLAQGANYKSVIVSPIPYGANFDGTSPFMMAGVATLINANAISDGFFRKADVNSDPIWTATPKSTVWRNSEYHDTVNDIAVHIKQPGEAKATQIVLNSFIADLPVTLPTLTTATVENANKNKVVLTYDRSLDTGSVPSTGDFAVSGGKSVTGVAIVGAVATLTVNSNYAFGDTITVSYTPGANPIKDASLGLSALGLTSQPVTNNIANPDVTAPTISSALVANANPNKIVLTYNEALDSGSVPATSDFAPSGGKTVTNVSISGSVVTLTVNSNYSFGDTISVSYTPGVNRIRDVAHNNAAALTSQAVTNNIANPDVTAPVLTTATVEDANKNKIVMTYDEALDGGSVPANGDFAVSGGKTVTGVVISGAVVTLTVTSNYAFGDTITVSYTPGSNRLRDAAHNNCAALSNRSVTNNIANPDVTAPTLSTATVENANPNKILLTYNETLDSGSVPANGDFTVPGKTVSNVSISGAVVTITVSVNFVHGDTIAISYVAGSNKIRDVAHNNAANLSSQSVTNNVSASDTTPPAITSAVIQSSEPNKIILHYGEALDEASTPANGDYSPSGGRSVTNVLVSGQTVELTVNTPYAEGDTVTISYMAGTNKIQDAAGNHSANLTNYAVTNNIGVDGLALEGTINIRVRSGVIDGNRIELTDVTLGLVNDGQILVYRVNKSSHDAPGEGEFMALDIDTYAPPTDGDQQFDEWIAQNTGGRVVGFGALAAKINFSAA